MKLSLIYFFSLALFLSLSESLCLAQNQQSLEGLMNSPQYKELRGSSALSNNSIFSNWVDDGTNYNRLFAPKQGNAKFLLMWIGNSVQEFPVKSSMSDENNQFVYAVRTYFIPKFYKELRLSILVPRPTSVKSVEYRLIPDFSVLEPPVLKVSQQRDLEIRGQRATLYQHQGGYGCSILIKLVKQAVASMYSPSCAYEREMIQVLENVDLKRLVDKLNS